MKRENLIVLIFGSVFLFSLIMILSYGPKTTGYATTATTTSNVTISVYFAIDMSQNLTNGLEFGNISTLPITNQNSTDNFNGLNTTAQGTYANATNGSSTWLNVSSDSNTAVDFCLKADAALTSGAFTIGIGNESYNNYSATNFTVPDVGTETAFTASYAKSGANVAAGNSHYYRFWLDVPSGISSGTYNNTLSFKGVATGGSCT